jgi:hypothetical protein
MRNLLLSVFVLSLSSTCLLAQDMEGASTSISRPKDIDVDFQTSYFESNPWIKEFHYVIVINKAKTGKDSQTIKVYEYEKLIISSRVSTGRDQFETAGEHHSKKDSWSVTPTGYYTPSYLDKNHKSAEYGGRWSKIFGAYYS